MSWSVESLLGKSLLWWLEEVEGEPRVGMLETVREFATEKLLACGEVAQLRDRHLHFYLDPVP
ncbi:MAG: hypothetical protein M3220_18765 [Chloroflexota bacterium]|nr:hypothetical protein [Chloroflexota bacterium]